MHGSLERMRYKQYGVSFLFIFGYAYAHFAYTGVPDFLTFGDWLHWDAPLPFMQRLLVPVTIQSLIWFFPDFLADFEWFFLVELACSALIFLVLLRLLQTRFDQRLALLLTWLFLLLLPLVFVLNFRFVMNGNGAIYMPYDMPAVLLSILGVFLGMQKRWFPLYLVVFLATLNRETGALLVAVTGVLYWGEHGMRYRLPWIIASFLLGKMSVWLLLGNHPGIWFEWYDTRRMITTFEFNMRWLMTEQTNIVGLVAFGLAGLPLLWFVVYDWIPGAWRRIKYPLFLYFLALLFVGRFPETRIFGEIVAFLYFPVCLGLYHWVRGAEPQSSLSGSRLLYGLDRYGITVALCSIIFLQHHIIQWINPWILPT